MSCHLEVVFVMAVTTDLSELNYAVLYLMTTCL